MAVIDLAVMDQHVAVMVCGRHGERLCSTETVGHTLLLGPFGDRSFAAASPGLKNSLPSHLKRCGLIVQSVPAVTKDIFVWIVGPWCSVNYFNCAI